MPARHWLKGPHVYYISAEINLKLSDSHLICTVTMVACDIGNTCRQLQPGLICLDILLTLMDILSVKWIFCNYDLCKFCHNHDDWSCEGD